MTVSGDKKESLSGIGVHLSGAMYHGDTCLFDGLSLDLKANQWTCLLGPSGVGKSTLLRLIAGLKTGGIFSGEVTASDQRDLSHRISYMAQSDLLFPWLNIKQNVLLGSQLRGSNPDHQRAEKLIDQVGLIEDVHKKPNQLSGGMRQRVALARTLMEDRPIVLLDEPFSDLDARTRCEMQDLAFNTLTNKTVLLVTHDPGEAVRLSGHLYIMSEGGLQEKKTCGKVPIRNVDDPEVMKAQTDLLICLRGL